MIKHAISLPAAGQPTYGANSSDAEPRGRGKLMHIYTKAGTAALVALVSLALGTLMVSHSSAQTKSRNQEIQSNKERNYQEELDKWMLRAYEGDRDAQFKVGVLFTNEQFSRPDFEQAVYWYKQAARQGHVLAQYNLGHQYLSGVGVAKSEIIAMDWWLKAAKQGHALAQFNIGRAYYLGIGLKGDQTLSREWFERAARNGEPKSIEILEQLGWSEKGQYTGQKSNAGTIGLGVANPDYEASDSAQNAATSEEAETIADAGKITEATKSAVPDNGQNSSTTTSEGTAGNQGAAAANATAPNATDNSDDNISQIAIYTDPAVRSVLIAIVKQRDELKLVRESGMWSIVSSRVGFPVWVHADYINVAADSGIISADSVNARSVPIVTSGTVVGRLNRNERVAVLDQQKNWFRIVAPTRFRAWVKTDDFKAASGKKVAINTAEARTVDNATPTSENAWLFKQPADSYTLQLASFDDPAKVSEFMSRAKFANNPELHRFTAQGKDIAWTYFLYGKYADTEKAEQAKEDIKQERAWIRSFGRLQQNRCVAWKKQLPTPKELNTYCVE